MAKVRSQSKIAFGLASSGIAALLLPGGRTAHFRKVPTDINELFVCNISKQSYLPQLIRRTNLWYGMKPVCQISMRRMCRSQSERYLFF